MKSLLKIYSKYIGITWIIIVILIMANLGGLMIFGISQMMESGRLFPVGIREIEKMVNEENPEEDFAMTPQIESYLKEKGFIFLLVLDDGGDVVYSWNQPEGFAEHYSLGEVAAFTRWYLHDYPVKVLRTDKGLLVAGREKNSVWKYSVELSIDFMNNILGYGQFFLMLNIVVVLTVVFLLGYRYYKSLRPLSDGISALSANQKIHLEEKGVAASLAMQINHTSDVLELQRKALEKRDTARTEWIAGVSHDIRTPLSMIMGYADELEQNISLSREERAKAAVIRSQSLKIRQLIEDLNLTSKLEYHMQPLRIHSFYPASLLRSLAAEIINEELGEAYELIPDIEPELEGFEMKGDEELIARAVRNLLSNSVRHNPKGCRIYLTGIRRNEGLLIRIRDDGCGIPEEIIGFLMEEKGGREAPKGQDFYETSLQGKEKPHIMGLRIVKQITLAHKGVFEIQEEGRCVNMWFPQAP